MTEHMDLDALTALEQAVPDAYQDDDGRVWLNLRKHPDGWPGAYDFDSTCSPLALTPTATVAHQARWKAEALPVMSGLQELGRALGVPLGKSITACESVDLALDLRNRATAAEAEVAALRERVEEVLNSAGEFVEPRVGSIDRMARALRAALATGGDRG